jgi:hypothetical protein
MDRPLFIVGRRRSAQPDGWGMPMPLLHDSIARVKEAEFIRKLLNHVYYSHSIFGLKDLPIDNAAVLAQVDRGHYRAELKGDFDILVVPRDTPEQATAIQVKRLGLKVGGADQPKLETIAGRAQRLFDEGVLQTSADERLGFSQVYLWMFVLVDSREQNEGRYTYEGASVDVMSRATGPISPSRLPGRVGLMTLEWAQPMDRPPLELATSGGHLSRLAQRSTQPPELTEWLRTLL